MEDIKETLVCVLKSTLRTKIVRGMMANALMTSTQPITRTTSTNIGSLKKALIAGEAMYSNKYITKLTTKLKKNTVL